ncbi:hypothetical protein D3C85_1056560 [compost metagenome]
MVIRELLSRFARMEVARMAIGNLELKVEMELLRSLTSCDFIAVAPLQDNKASNGWIYALGNENERFQHMTIKIGVGLAGAALRYGREVKLDDTHPRMSQERLNCPVMLAEHLQTAAVFPIRDHDSPLIKGLLYIGKRQQARFDPDELLAVQDKINRIASLLEDIKEEIAK